MGGWGTARAPWQPDRREYGDGIAVPDLPGEPGSDVACLLGRVLAAVCRRERCEQAKRAAAAPSGRSADTVYGGHEHALRQTVLALTADSSQHEHESPGEATIQVLRGRVRLTAGTVAWKAVQVISWSCRAPGTRCRPSRTQWSC